MDIEIKVPVMGESIVEVTIGALLKPSGADVLSGEEIVEIETDKVNQVLSAPTSGKLLWKVKTGDVAAVGQSIGTIQAGEVAAKPKTAPIPEPKQEEKIPPKPSGVSIRVQVDEAINEILTPAQPSVSKKEAAPPSSPIAGERRKKMTKLRKVIAERLVSVKNQTAMLTTFNEVDMSAVMAVREKEQESFQKKHGVKLGFMSFFVKACAAALEQFPDVNARIEKDEIVYHDFIHIGVAVSTEKGLMVPVLRSANTLSYAEIERQLKNFAEQARNGTIAVDAMQGGTFTITNGGVFGSLLSTPILNPPQSGILGMHNIVQRPIALNGEVVIRPMMYLALSYDHRIVDGKESIQFLMHIKKSLEEPARLLLDL